MAEFDQISVLLVDPGSKVRDHVVAALREAGFSKLRLGATLGNITNGIDEETPDPLL